MAKTHNFAAILTPVGNHTMAHATLVGHKDIPSAVRPILGAIYANISVVTLQSQLASRIPDNLCI